MPLATPLELPAVWHKQAIWTLLQLPNGDLFVGGSDRIAIGRPRGRWNVVPTPAGRQARTASFAHERLLVAGHGFCGFLSEEGFTLFETMRGEYVSAEAITEGWLVAGRDGLWRIDPRGQPERLTDPSPIDGQTRVGRIGAEVVVSLPGSVPQVWSHGRLVSSRSWSALGPVQVGPSQGRFLATTAGIRDRSGQRVFSESLDRDILQAGLLGVAEVGPWLLVATFRQGLIAYDAERGQELWRWPGEDPVYAFTPHDDGFLLGTAQAAFFIPDPWRYRVHPLASELISDLRTVDAHRVELNTATGSRLLSSGNDDAVAAEPSEAYLEAGRLHFRGVSAALPSRFVSVPAVCGDSAAVGLEQGLWILHADGRTRSVPVPSVLTALVAHKDLFLIGTFASGVLRVSPEGELLGQIGDGRASVASLPSGQAVLLFWDGRVLDASGELLGKTTLGHPRSATLLGDTLAVLISRPARSPLVSLLEKEAWRLLELPTLAEIGAEKIAATADALFVAGPHGVLLARTPLSASAPPRVQWHWSAPRVDQEVQLPAEANGQITLDPKLMDLPPSPATSVRGRLGAADWEEISLAHGWQFSIPWGRTDVTLQAERNGLIQEEHVTLVRPWPWWLQPIGWALHAAVAIGFVLGLVRLRTRALERRNRELEARVAQRTEQLHQANAAKEEFLAGISHEIRNPLNGVVGICAMLAERDVAPYDRKLLQTLGGCADQLRSMLDDILDFSQIERGVVTLANQPFEVTSLVEEAVRVMDPDMSACSLLLPEQPVWLEGDSGKLRQIVSNLVSNALKYGVPREAGIEARVEAAGDGRKRLRLAVRNTGATLSAEEWARLFQPFQRGSRTVGIPGSGLGLAVCRRLSLAMGAHLSGGSADGVTEFAVEVVLPVSRPPVIEPPPRAVSRALAIEDEEYNRLVLGHVLLALGYQVDWAGDGQAALQLVRDHTYDLILTDWRLPDMDGGELVRQLLARLPDPKPPVLAITAYSTREKRQEAQRIGMAGFITKPVTKDKLEAAIRSFGRFLQPKRSLDTVMPAPAAAALSSLDDLAPSAEQLSAAVAASWERLRSLAALSDPRVAREAHALRSLLLFTGEDLVADQLEILETAADAGDWAAVQQLLPVIQEDLANVQVRLGA